MAIKAFGSDNFRSLALDNIQLGRITVLCGANSVGKSSILKSLLLLKQFDAEGDIGRDLLPLNGQYVNLGTYRNLVRNHDIDADITLSATVPCEKMTGENIGLADGRTVRYDLTVGYKNETQSRLKEYRISVHDSSDEELAWCRIKNEEGIFTAEAEFRKVLQPCLTVLEDVERFRDYAKKDNKQFQEFVDAFSGNVVDAISKGVDTDESWKKWCADHAETIQQLTPFFLEAAAEAYKEDSSLQRSEKEPTSVSSPFNGCPFADGLLLDGHRAYGNNSGYIEEFLNVVQAGASIRQVLNGLEYLGPIRAVPTRYQTFNDAAGKTVGIYGENAPYVLAMHGEDPVERPWYTESKNEAAWFVQKDESASSTFRNEAERWFDLMGIGQLRCAIDEKGIVTVSADADGSRDNVADTGFGIGQVFPIIVEGLRMDQNAVLFVEQPEVHLHPKMQGDLTDFFIAMALSGKRFVIETHSDHIINRLVRRVVEDGLEREALNIKDLIKIYFVEKVDGEVEMNEVMLDSERGDVNWPKGFFDESQNELRKILRASIKKERRKSAGEYHD